MTHKLYPTIKSSLLRIHRSPKDVTLEILTETLGLGTKGFFAQHRKNSSTSSMKSKSENVIAMPRFPSYPSIESTNTISNSSLQDLDETEFTESELTRYMGELNFDSLSDHSSRENVISRIRYRAQITL